MLNRSILMGRLTSDPELRQTPNGVSVTTFSLAVNRTFNRDITDFINIVAWRQTAEFVSRYFKKGQLVAVEGSIQTRNYEDKMGNKRVAFEVVADQVYFAESKNSSPGFNEGSHLNSSNFGSPSGFANNAPSPSQGFSNGDFEGFEELDADDEDLPF